MQRRCVAVGSTVEQRRWGLQSWRSLGPFGSYILSLRIEAMLALLPRPGLFRQAAIRAAVPTLSGGGGRIDLGIVGGSDVFRVR